MDKPQLIHQSTRVREALEQLPHNRCPMTLTSFPSASVQGAYDEMGGFSSGFGVVGMLMFCLPITPDTDRNTTARSRSAA